MRYKIMIEEGKKSWLEGMITVDEAETLQEAKEKVAIYKNQKYKNIAIIDSEVGE